MTKVEINKIIRALEDLKERNEVIILNQNSNEIYEFENTTLTIVLFNYSGKIKIINSTAFMLSFSKNKIDIDSKNSRVVHSHINDDQSEFNYRLVVDSNKKGSLLFNSVNYGKLIVNAEGVIERDVFNAEVNVELQCLNIQGNAILNPNLEINSKNVKAAHSAKIHNFNKNMVFYFLSRGIDIDNAKLILIKSFLTKKQNEIISKLIHS